MMGKQYEDGLAAMKKIAESKPTPVENVTNDSTAVQTSQ